MLALHLFSFSFLKTKNTFVIKFNPIFLSLVSLPLQKKDMEVLRGYLSLHQAVETLTLKWTPNQLINGTLGDCDLDKRYV